MTLFVVDSVGTAFLLANDQQQKLFILLIMGYKTETPEKV